RGDLADAVDRFQAVLRAEPGLETVRRDLALALMRSERWAEAEPVLEHLFTRYPDSAELGYLRALALFNLNRNDEASAAARALVARFPKASDARTLLGLVLTRQGAPASDV